MAPGSSKVWHGWLWESHTLTLCCMMTSMWNTRPNTQISSVSTMQFLGNKRTTKAKKMYIQTKMAEYTEELWNLMQDSKTHVYMCGLKGMEQGMEECFSEIASKNDLVWKEFAKQMKKDKRYHVEVY